LYQAPGQHLLFLFSRLRTIEQLFAQLKALLRKAGERPLKVPGGASPTLLDAFTPSECASFPPFRAIQPGFGPLEMQQ